MNKLKKMIEIFYNLIDIINYIIIILYLIL